MSTTIYCQCESNGEERNQKYMLTEKLPFTVSASGAALTGTSGWLIENHVLLGSIGIIVGTVVGVGGLIVQIWWVFKQHKIQKEKLHLEKKSLEKKSLEKNDD